MDRTAVFAAALLWLAATPSMAQTGPDREGPKLALFGFSLLNTSPAPSTAEEAARIDALDTQLAAALAAPGRYAVVDGRPLQARTGVAAIRGCNGCERDMAQQAGARFAAYGWVQKVSNLILNINVVIEDAASGQVVKADSVDIRGNTDESWRRGLRYLIDERFYRD